LFEVVVEIAPEGPAQRAGQIEQPAVGAVLQQDPVEVVVELDAAGDVAASLLQPVNDAGQAIEPLTTGLGGLVERQRLQGSEDRSDLAQLGRIEWSKTEPPAGLRRQEALPGETQHGFADRRPADAQFDRDGNVTELDARDQESTLNALQDLKIDLLAEGSALDCR
jgi:hypothetical protein